MPDVVKHAWTHRPRSQGGTDPIAFPTAEAGFPVIYELMWPGMLNNGTGYDGYAYTDNFGTNRYNPYYIEAPADGDHFTRIVRLGPAGSLWSATVVCRRASDAGRIKLQIASLDEDPTTGFVYNGPGALEDSDGAGVTFYDIYFDASTSTLRKDLYSAGTTEYEFQGNVWRFRLEGTGPLTTTPVTNGADLTTVDAGAGMYAIRFLTDGKNASSSSFKARFHYAILHRITGDEYTV